MFDGEIDTDHIMAMCATHSRSTDIYYQPDIKHSDL